MITSSPTKLEPPRPDDGSLRDLHPGRRQTRLRDGGVRIERIRPLAHRVHLPDGTARDCRTYGTAERLAHSYLDQQA
jgi:hypothetical protein